MRAYRTLGVAAGACWAFANLAAAGGDAASAFSVASAFGTAADNRCPDHTAIALEVQGGLLCAAIDDPGHAIRTQLLRDWIERSARIVAGYYARFPAPLVVLRIRSSPGDGVHGGRTTNEAGLVIQVSVGREVTADELSADWVLVHEMVHLALPELGRQARLAGGRPGDLCRGHRTRAVRQSRRRRRLG